MRMGLRLMAKSDNELFTVNPVLTWELYAYGFARTLVNFINHLAWRVSVFGSEKLPDGAFILAPSHRANIDTLLVASITTRRLRYMGKDGVWKYRIIGALLSALGGFPVHRGIADRDAMRKCSAVLTAGEPLVLFPEGTRKSGPVIEGIFEGAAYLAAKANVPIVPVGIGGSERAWGKVRKFPRFTKISIVVGDPIYPELKEEGAKSSRTARSSLVRFSSQLTLELQKVFDEAQTMVGAK